MSGSGAESGVNRTRLRWTAWGLATSFVVLTAWIEIAGSVAGDHRALVELDRAIGTTLDDLMVFVGQATDSVPLLVLAIAVSTVLFARGRRLDAAWFSSIVAVALVVNPLLKYLVARPRPAVRDIPEALSTHSFPSGHAASTIAFVGALALVAFTPRRRNVILAIGTGVVGLTAFSRLAIGAHYPSDIVGGWLWVGSFLAFLWPNPTQRTGCSPRRRQPAEGA